MFQNPAQESPYKSNILVDSRIKNHVMDKWSMYGFGSQCYAISWLPQGNAEKGMNQNEILKKAMT